MMSNIAKRSVLMVCAGLSVIALGACNGLSAADTSSEPDFAQMTPAKPMGKVSVPVDVRYEIATPSGGASKSTVATVQIAFVPRVAGSALRVEFPGAPGNKANAEPLQVEKAASAAVYRRKLVVGSKAAEAGVVRALVSMDVDGGRYFGIFAIPVGSVPVAPSGKGEDTVRVR